MKTVILAGGYGTRLNEYTELIPKPMVPIGGKPILWHIMKYYSSFGHNDFIICLGYKGYVIKEFFFNYYKHNSNIKIDLKNDSLEILNSNVEPWSVSLIDTGNNVMTGGRLKKLIPYLEDNESFFMTYGDGLANVDLSELSKFHQAHNGSVTMTAVSPPGRFGAIQASESGKVNKFLEKPENHNHKINGGFFVIDTTALSTIEGDLISWEREPLEQLTIEQKLYNFNHNGFWQCMDTKRDKDKLEQIWESGQAPWKSWK